MLKDLLQKVASALDKLAVPYAVIGGLAVITRGVVRATKDVDILVDWPLRQAAALAQSLTANGLPATFHRGDADDPLPGVIRIIIAYPAGPIRCDILFPSRAWQAETVRKAARVEVEGLAVPVVQAADLSFSSCTPAERWTCSMRPACLSCRLRTSAGCGRSAPPKSIGPGPTLDA
ncbi:MAG: hypothetical protein DMG27_15000 [Acidobacteria bacterium]|nr:MAG: hypothetical protein DMG27_15000 [Acidobacteriota bacterium]